MKSARIFGPRDIRVVDVAQPEPGPNEVLIRVEAAGVCASDVILWKGNFPYIAQGLTTYPFTPGHEWCGTVERCGSAVRTLAVGQRVVGEASLGCGECLDCLVGRYDICEYRRETGSRGNKEGGYAEYIVMPARHCVPLPGPLTAEEGAIALAASEALYALQKATRTLGGTVVVQGDGPIGLLSLQAARACGAALTVVAGCYDNKLETAVQLGASAVVNVTRDSLREHVLRLTGGKGADVVVEASGSTEALAETVDLARAGGEAVIIGIFQRPLPEFDMNRVVLKDMRIYGSHVSPGMLGKAIQLMAAGAIQVKPLITHRFGLSDVAAALAVEEERAAERLKIVLDPSR